MPRAERSAPKDSFWDLPAMLAAANGHVDCLRVLHEIGGMAQVLETNPPIDHAAGSVGPHGGSHCVLTICYGGVCHTPAQVLEHVDRLDLSVLPGLLMDPRFLSLAHKQRWLAEELEGVADGGALRLVVDRADLGYSTRGGGWGRHAHAHGLGRRAHAHGLGRHALPTDASGTRTLPHHARVLCSPSRARLTPPPAFLPPPRARARFCATLGEDLLGGLCAQLGVQQDGGGLLPGVRAQGLAVKPAPLIGVQCALRVPLACTAGGQRVPGRGACHAARESLLGLNCRCRSAARAAWATGCGASGSR